MDRMSLVVKLNQGLSDGSLVTASDGFGTVIIDPKTNILKGVIVGNSIIPVDDLKNKSLDWR